MSSQNNKNFIVRKKVYINPIQPLGGNWKVAYADFVTALMAFFLLLWILNSTPSTKLKLIAEYFEPSIGLLNLSGLVEGDKKKRLSEADDELDTDGHAVNGVKYGVKQIGQVISISRKDTDFVENEDQHFALIQDSIRKEIEQDVYLSQYNQNLHFSLVPEGLIIDIIDQHNSPMFDRHTPNLLPSAQRVLDKIVQLVRYAPNMIAINGHTSKSSVTLSDKYTAWTLSAARANTAMEFLLKKGISGERIAKLTAFADSNPLDETNPSSENNRRVSIVLLRDSFAPAYKISAPKSISSPR